MSSSSSSSHTFTSDVPHEIVRSAMGGRGGWWRVEGVGDGNAPLGCARCIHVSCVSKQNVGVDFVVVRAALLRSLLATHNPLPRSSHALSISLSLCIALSHSRSVAVCLSVALTHSLASWLARIVSLSLSGRLFAARSQSRCDWRTDPVPGIWSPVVCVT